MNETVDEIKADVLSEESESESYEPPAPTEEEEAVKVEDSFEEQNGEDKENQVDYAEVERKDVSELKELFSELSELKSITELDNPLRYAALRDLGLTVKEAYLATQRRTPRYDNRAHLRSSVPRGAKSSGVSMSAEALNEARELFSGLSDTEIQQLYKKVIK